MRTFRKGGIHPPEDKLTADIAISRLPEPKEVRLLLSQCIGAPSKCVVKPNDKVVVGQLIAEAGGFVGAPIHSPVNGTVKKIEKVRNVKGLWADSVLIEVEQVETAEEIAAEAVADAVIASAEKKAFVNGLELDPKEIIKIVGDAGIVGLGGATFPTRVKLSVPEGKHADFIVINGAECEPYLTCDDRLMREDPESIVRGTKLLMRASGAPKAVIGIEQNKPEAIEAMRQACAGEADIEVYTLVKKYPQGSEKQLIDALTGRKVPAGGLPIDVGCIVDNVATAAAVAAAVEKGEVLTERVITVTGPDVKNPGNFIVPFGTSLRELIDYAGGLPEGTGKVIAGGPMMGQAVADLDAPTTKGVSGVLILPEKLSKRLEPVACVRCARCVTVCPMGLSPYLLAQQAAKQLWEDCLATDALSCLECGSCQYICPSARPLLDYIRLAKAEIRKLPKK